MHHHSRVYVLGVFLLLNFLESCSFRPLYGTSHPQLGRIKVATIPTRSGQLLRNFLLERLEAFSHPDTAYTLKVTLGNTTRPIAYNKDATAARNEEKFTADVVLLDTSTHQPLWQETVTAATGRSIITDAPHLYYLSREQSYLLENLAQQIIVRLSCYFRLKEM